MTEPMKYDEPIYGIVLTDSQEVEIMEIRHSEEVLDCARRTLDCEMVQIVKPCMYGTSGYVLLIDEDRKLRNDDMFVNCIASYIYNPDEHSDVIIGDAIMVKREGDSLRMLTGHEVSVIKDYDISAYRQKAIATIASAFQIKPKPVPTRRQSVISTLRQSEKKDQQPEKKNRQPCRNDGKER